MTDTRLAVREAAPIVQQGFDDPTRELIRKAVSDPRQPLSQDEFDLFLAVCRHTGLNPLLKEIYAVRIDGRFSVLPGVDGYRRIAQSSPRFRGMAGPLWCGADGEWVDAWLGDGPPAACKVGVYLPGQREPTWAVAYYKNYRNRRTPTWQTMPEHMLAIRAEVHALRKCFSRELGGIAMPDEDDTGLPEVDRDEEQLPPSTRAPAIAAQLDAALAEADALLEEPAAPAEEMGDTDADIRSLATFVHGDGEAPTGVLPGPRWGSTPLGRQVSAMVDALTEANKTFTLPADDADEATLRGWIASKRGVLGQRASTPA